MRIPNTCHNLVGRKPALAIGNQLVDFTPMNFTLATPIQRRFIRSAMGTQRIEISRIKDRVDFVPKIIWGRIFQGRIVMHNS